MFKYSVGLKAFLKKGLCSENEIGVKCTSSDMVSRNDCMHGG